MQLSYKLDFMFLGLSDFICYLRTTCAVIRKGGLKERGRNPLKYCNTTAILNNDYFAGGVLAESICPVTKN